MTTLSLNLRYSQYPESICFERKETFSVAKIEPQFIPSTYYVLKEGLVGVIFCHEVSHLVFPGDILPVGKEFICLSEFVEVEGHPTESLSPAQLLTQHSLVFNDHERKEYWRIEGFNGPKKILSTLRYVASRTGRNLKDGSMSLEFLLTHKVLSGLTGTSRETITSNVAILRKKGLVTGGSKSDLFTITKKGLSKEVHEFTEIK